MKEKYGSFRNYQLIPCNFDDSMSKIGIPVPGLNHEEKRPGLTPVLLAVRLSRVEGSSPNLIPLSMTFQCRFRYRNECELEWFQAPTFPRPSHPHHHTRPDQETK
jgi:hypothetical protein